MAIISRTRRWFLATFLTLSSLLDLIKADLGYPSVVNAPVSWVNSLSNLGSFETAGVRPVLVNGNFVCGFHCAPSGESCLFAISFFNSNSYTDATGSSSPSQEMVWSANRNNPVQLEAVLRFTQQGNLILQDGDGALVWSTNITAKSVSRLQLTTQGNLVLFDKLNNVFWQSFDHPTDCLVPGQRLLVGKKLRSSLSASNWSEGFYSLTIDDNSGLTAFMETNPPQVYYRSSLYEVPRLIEGHPIYTNFEDIASVLFYEFFTNITISNTSITIVKIGSDGHLTGYWTNLSWTDSLQVSACDYPLACGKYGLCFDSGNCSCPGDAFNGENTYNLRPTDYKQPYLGCSLARPIACELSPYQSLLKLADQSLNAFTLASFINNTRDEENCKQACLRNCSCKAVIFRQYNNLTTAGDCSLASEVFSFGSNGYYYTDFYNSSIFIKVQNSPVARATLEKNLSSVISREDRAVIIGSTLGSILGLLILCTIFFVFIKICSKKVEEDYLDHISGLPTRFSYEELKVLTKNFSIKLGEGGFGSVFKGTLSDGVEVAVKHLDGFGPVNKSFITEVQTIGSIHHFNLVSLVGFCAEKFRRLLIYEYMCNGSLDRWIFKKNKELALSWQSRKKIILDIAKGLAYLHEQCKQKIIHLDIKPQNILLDENFNAKVSDFGLSKLVGRNQSQVVTTMRGTPGYMAPEWLSSVITEKVDVYSYGIVVLEILCGRPNVDRSEPEEDMHVVSLFKRKAEEGQLQDLVDKSSDDMQSNAAEIVETMKVAACCLQSQTGRRPSMSMVVKVLEGSLHIEDCLSYDFTSLPGPEAAATVSLTLPSFLSGPR